MKSAKKSLAFIIVLANLFILARGIILSNCQANCVCDLTFNVLTISCSQTPATFNLPDPSTDIRLNSVLTIIAKNSKIQNFPINICQYRNSLTFLDLSLNQISGTLTNSFLSCLTNLQSFNASSNLISAIEETAFDSSKSLNTINLNNNRITNIPTYLFNKKPNSLKYLYLANNLLTTLDPWYFYLSNIDTIDLSFNRISQLTNDINWSLYGQQFLTQGRDVVKIDLSYNKLTKFDDSVLQFYNLCTRQDIVFYLQILYKMKLDQNPFDCSCQNSYNLLTFVQQSISMTALDPTQLVFNAACQTPSIYKGLSIFRFTNPNTNCLNSIPFVAGVNCPLVTTTTTSTTTTTTLGILLSPNQNINTPQLQLADDGSGVLKIISPSGSYIAGIIIAFLGALILFLLLLYCICPIEILAVIFDCIPYFYSCCPCKSGAVRKKEYDLFISYNKSTEKWVRGSLIPFIKAEYLVENFILHYNEENKKSEVFNDYVRKMMNQSSCILFVLSDSFLLKEWNNLKFRKHLQHLVTKEKTRFLCVQMHDVNDETVEEYFRTKLKLPYFVSLECDEFLFWKKLGYHLYTNDLNRQIVVPVVPTDIIVQPNDDINFDRYNINRPIIHLHGKHDPFANDKPKQELKLNFTPAIAYDYEEKKKPKKPKKEKKQEPVKEKENAKLIETRTPSPENELPPIDEQNSENENKIEIIDEPLSPPPPPPEMNSPEPQPKIKEKRRHRSKEKKVEEIQQHVRMDLFETRKDKIYNPFEDKLHDADIPVGDLNHQAKARRNSYDSQQQQQIMMTDFNYNYQVYSNRKRGSIEDLDYRIMKTGYGRGANSDNFKHVRDVSETRSSTKARRTQGSSHSHFDVPDELLNSPYLKRSNSGHKK